MRVKVYLVDKNTGAQTLVAGPSYAADFAEANELTDSERAAMERGLTGSGRYWIGGGAAPLFYLSRA